MDANTAAAIAAAFSALAAFLSWRAQVDTVRHTFRPEIQLGGWRRLGKSPAGHDVLAFTTVSNVGRDTARRVDINVLGARPGVPLVAAMSTVRLERLAANQSESAVGQINVFWTNFQQIGAGKMVVVHIQAVCWDAMGMRHETIWKVLVFEGGTSVMAGGVELTDDTYLLEQSTEAVAVWRLRVRAFFRTLPLIGWFFGHYDPVNDRPI